MVASSFSHDNLTTFYQHQYLLKKHAKKLLYTNKSFWKMRDVSVVSQPTFFYHFLFSEEERNYLSSTFLEPV